MEEKSQFHIEEDSIGMLCFYYRKSMKSAKKKRGFCFACAAFGGARSLRDCDHCRLTRHYAQSERVAHILPVYFPAFIPVFLTPGLD